MEKRKFSWKEALLLVLVLAVAAGVYLYAKTRPKGAEAVIEQDGEVYRRVVLADLKEPLTKTAHISFRARARTKFV